MTRTVRTNRSEIEERSGSSPPSWPEGSHDSHSGGTDAVPQSGDESRRGFLLDVMCGKLAVYLRMCGHDAAYALDRDVEADDRLLDIIRAEARTLVTRDRRLAAQADDVLLLDSTDVTEQLRGLQEAGVRLTLEAEPTYCGACNGPLDRVPPETTTPDYAPEPSERDAWRCRACGQLFWKGSHWESVEERLSNL